MIVFAVWVTHLCCYCREKRSTMAEIVEQVQEREAANVSLFKYIFLYVNFSLCLCITFMFFSAFSGTRRALSAS